MNKKFLYIIPLFFLEAVIQLGFFWLAPSCECRWMAYSFLTVMTIAHLALTFVIMSEYGVRKSAATVVAGSFIQTLSIIATVWLLTVRATERSALFLMLMLMALYIAVVAILWISIEGFGENYVDRPRMEDDEPENEDDAYRVSECRENARRTPPPIPVKH